MRRQRNRPLSQVLEELKRYPPDSLVDAVDGGTILILDSGQKSIGAVDCVEAYDDGVPDPDFPTF